jgi:Amt family ammonium transporter
MLLVSGKLTAIALCMVALIIMKPELMGLSTAAADPQLTGNSIVNPLNTVWTLVAAFLVFGMQVGFTMLEAGFCRSRETVNVLMECIVDTCLCGLLFYAWGFAFMFSHGNGFMRQVSTIHSISTLTVSRDRQKPASSIVKPTCIPNTRNAATS